MDETKRKLARHAEADEIFPDRTHAPIQPELHDTMNRVMPALQLIFGPNYHLTLFVAEIAPPSGADRLPRFNYISTAERADMLAVLEAFVAKNRAAAAKLDRIDDTPPSGSKQ